jgi:hypothetical protein
MAIYTVHEPPLKRDQTAPDPERFVFVREGFAFWAFLLAPLWMLRHRLWLVFTCYVLLTIALQIALRAIGLSEAVMVAVGALCALLVGLEAATLRRFTLSRRGWKNVGIVVGDDVEAVERRFFDAWFDKSGDLRRPIPPASAVPIMRAPQGSSHGSPQGSSHGSPQTSPEIIGLFPEPGAPR